MTRMDVWGQGALFAFSGLEGKTDFSSQLVGTLLGDHPGIRFMTASPFELYIDTTDAADLVWETVASDIILGKMRIRDAWHRVCFVFQSNATVAGICPEGRLLLGVRFGKGKTGRNPEHGGDGRMLPVLPIDRGKNGDQPAGN